MWAFNAAALTDDMIDASDAQNMRAMRQASAQLRDSVRLASGLHPFNRPATIRHIPLRLADLTEHEKGTWMGVVQSVARFSGVPAETLVAPNKLASRKARYVRARSLVMLILRNRGFSYPRIGEWLGGRDHSTVINSVKRIEATIRADERELVLSMSRGVSNGDA